MKSGKNCVIYGSSNAMPIAGNMNPGNNLLMKTRTDSEILEWISIWVEEIISMDHEGEGEIIVIKFHDPYGFRQANSGQGKNYLDALRDAVIPCMGMDAHEAMCTEPVAN